MFIHNNQWEIQHNRCLNPADIRDELRGFCESESIALFKEDVGVNIEPFITMSYESVKRVIDIILNKANQPCLLFCTTGKIRTSCMIACLRKHQQWSMAIFFVRQLTVIVIGINS